MADSGLNSEVTVADEAMGEGWHIWNGDCVLVARGLPADFVDYTIYSPPFKSLYTFSDDPRDMSNCRSDDVFWQHYGYLISECFRVTKPGRLVSVHCMNLPTSKLRDGFIGITDFRGEIIRLHQRAGFHFHSEVVIRKDPVSAMQRSKAIGLLHKQICKDSSLSRMAIPDYVVTFRKPGDNAEPISGRFDAYYGDEAEPDGPLKVESNYFGTRYFRPEDGDGYSIAVWQRYAEPVWMDIAQGDVLPARVAREKADERHIAPLQLTVIRRCIDLWSNPGDIVFSPFAGIGSELYIALQLGRRGIGAELKTSYFKQAVCNCAVAKQNNGDLLSHTGHDEIVQDEAVA